MSGYIAVIDIGKTNAKLALVDPEDLAEIAVLTRPNTPLPGPPYPHFDVEGHWQFLLAGLRDFHASHGIAAISITTHGACAALLDAQGALAAPVLDYEHQGPDALAAEYAAIRPDFTETGSPKLAAGLNIGAQLYWQFAQDQSLISRTAHLVTYPQYWGHRLTGELATDVTSLGCHTDLWNPRQGQFSSLVAKLGLTGKIAPARQSAEVLGTLLPEVAAATGLPPNTEVRTGIHDSNASLLPHILGRTVPFSVVSTGTWVVCMAIGGSAPGLDPARDTLINVSALGQPVPSARFMGGREYDLAMAGSAAEASPADIAAVLSGQAMLLPSLAADTGPFQQRKAKWLPEAPSTAGQRAATVAFYLALVTAQSLRLIGHQGEIVVEGPFARNRAYLGMLAAAMATTVRPSPGATGTARGAALLVTGARPLAELEPVTAPQGFAAYSAAWVTKL
jgi:sugar (pentulose or hexulose) kinase